MSKVKEFTNTIFEMFKDGKKEQAKVLIETTLNEALQHSSSDLDLKGVMTMAINDIKEKSNDAFEKAAADVVSKIKNTADWNILATIYLGSKGYDEKSISKIIKIVEELYK